MRGQVERIETHGAGNLGVQAHVVIAEDLVVAAKETNARAKEHQNESQAALAQARTSSLTEAIRRPQQCCRQREPGEVQQHWHRQVQDAIELAQGQVGRINQTGGVRLRSVWVVVKPATLDPLDRLGDV